MQKLLPLIPLANSPGNVFVGSAVAPVNIHQGTANFTQSISDTNRFNAYYAMQHDQRDEPPSTDGNNLPNFGDQRQGWRQLLTLNDVDTVSGNLVNEARAGFNRIHIVFAGENQLNAATYGIDSGVNSAIGLPQISVSGAFSFGGINGFPQGRGDDNITLSDTVSWVKGPHSFKFGAEAHRVIDDSFSYSPGTFSFPSISAFLTDQANQFTANSSNHAARINVYPSVALFKIIGKFLRGLPWTWDYATTGTALQRKLTTGSSSLIPLLIVWNVLAQMVVRRRLITRAISTSNPGSGSPTT